MRGQQNYTWACAEKVVFFFKGLEVQTEKGGSDGSYTYRDKLLPGVRFSSAGLQSGGCN
jgi:hypothetical protein